MPLFAQQNWLLDPALSSGAMAHVHVNWLSPTKIRTMIGGGSARTNNVTFRQPIMTYEENQLIIAEALFQAGDVTGAATALNTVRARYSKPALATPTLNDIMTEKYILLCQNLEAWNDWKRTCLPARKPAKDKTVIPGRIYYGETEEQTNHNTPASTAQTLSSVRNANDPAACPST